jgi:hypothetical protein
MYAQQVHLVCAFNFHLPISNALTMKCQLLLGIEFTGMLHHDAIYAMAFQEWRKEINVPESCPPAGISRDETVWLPAAVDANTCASVEES